MVSAICILFKKSLPTIVINSSMLLFRRFIILFFIFRFNLLGIGFCVWCEIGVIFFFPCGDPIYQSTGNDHSDFAPNLRGKPFNNLPLNVMFAVGVLVAILHGMKKVSFYYLLAKRFFFFLLNHELVLNIIIRFLVIYYTDYIGLNIFLLS